MRNLCLLLSIVECFFLCFATSNDIQEVRIKPSDLLNDGSKVHKILSNRPLHIVFDGINVKSLSCATKNNMQYILPGKHTLVNFNNGTSILKTPGLTSHAKILFACAGKSSEGVITNVKINIETAYRILSVVNGKQKRFILRETPEYEGITNHLCKKGEVVDLTCSKYLNYGRLKLKYYDQNGTKLVETDEVGSKDPLNFRLIARAENDQSYVDCIHIDDVRHNRTEFTYRVNFIIVDEDRNNSKFIITINGMEFTSKFNYYGKDSDVNTKIYSYYYKFIYSDTLNITCENNNKKIVSDVVARLLTNSDIVELVDFKQTQSLYSSYLQMYVVETKYLDVAIMIFTFTDLNKIEIYTVMIKFYMDDVDPVILGLSQSNILYQYNKSATDWFIHYQYKVNEVLKLKCLVKKNSYLQWIYGENIVLPVLLNVAYGTSYIKYDFHTDTETKEIICEARSIAYGTRRITIVLHKIPGLRSLENKNEIFPEKQSKIFEIIGIIAGLLLAVMCAICCWRVKRRTQANKEKRLARNACGDANRVDDFTDQREYHEYAVIEYSDTTHSDVLNVNQGSSTPIRAPAPPPRSPLPAKNTRLQLQPSGCTRHGITNQRSSQECTHIEYDYVYGVKKKCPCVAQSNPGVRKPKAKLPAQ